MEITRFSLSACDVSGIDKIDFIPYKGSPVRETIKKDGSFYLIEFNVAHVFLLEDYSV